MKPSCDVHIEVDGAACSLWWTEAPTLPGERIGCIGEYESAGGGPSLLRAACERLREARCTLAVGPMDGNTWRRYRFVTDYGTAPRFFLEPWNPPEWPQEFEAAGFEVLARYSSSAVSITDARPLVAVETRLARRGVRIRTIDGNAFAEELAAIHDLCLDAFADNFLYTPIARVEFLSMYSAIESVVVPELVLIAEVEGDAVGFVFAIPDVESPGGREMIVKTLAVHSRRRHWGLGSVLTQRVQANGRRLGFAKAIHALQHECNASLKITQRVAGERMRGYALFSKRLDT